MFKKILLIGIPVLLLIGVLGFVLWGSTPLPASPAALAALQSTSQVNVEAVQDWIVFRPNANLTQTGFIFYPGGRVDYRAYAPLLRMVAEQGYLVVLVPMPLNLAFFGVEQAQPVLAAFPEIKHWAIGGHSLGGSMAAQFVTNHPGQVAGLVLWASYPAGSLADLPVAVLSVSASNDGLATPTNIVDSRKLLPVSARYVVIEGGNHAQFGSYGAQPGDNHAAILPPAQWGQTAKATVELLKQIGQ